MEGVGMMAEKYSCCFCRKEVQQAVSVVLGVYAFLKQEE